MAIIELCVLPVTEMHFMTHACILYPCVVEWSMVSEFCQKTVIPGIYEGIGL